MSNWGYTLEVYKADRRIKAGERRVAKIDYEDYSGNAMMDVIKDLKKGKYPPSRGYRLEFHQTWVQKNNLMSGQPFWERYDTPYYCSPSSETYWSM